MNAYWIRPEVAGELGPRSSLDTSVYPPRVTRLHYEFSNWMGDDIVESFPTVIVTATLADAIMSFGLSGVEFDDVDVTLNHQFEEFSPDVASSLPAWRWLRPVGQPLISDFWQDDSARLMLSEAALDVIRRFRIGNAELSEL